MGAMLWVLLGSCLAALLLLLRSDSQRHGNATATEAAAQGLTTLSQASQSPEVRALLLGPNGPAEADRLLAREWCGDFRSAEYQSIARNSAEDILTNLVGGLLLSSALRHELSHLSLNKTGIVAGSVDSEVFARLADVATGPIPHFALSELLASGHSASSKSVPNSSDSAAGDHRLYDAALVILADFRARLAQRSDMLPTLTSSDEILLQLHQLTAQQLSELAASTLEDRFGNGSHAARVAFQSWRESAESDPRMRRAVSSFRKNQLEEGISALANLDPAWRIQALEQLRGKHESSAALARALGVAYTEARRYEKAVDELARAKKADASDLPGLLAHARTCVRSGRYEQAEDSYSLARQLSPSSLDALVGVILMRFHSSGGAQQDAIAQLRVTPHRGHPDSMRLLALYELAQGNYPAALEELLALEGFEQRADLKDDSGRPVGKSSQAPMLLGTIHALDGRLDAARAAFERAVDLAWQYNTGATRRGRDLIQRYFLGDRLSLVGLQLRCDQVYGRTSRWKASRMEDLHAALQGMPTALDLRTTVVDSQIDDVAVGFWLAWGENLFSQNEMMPALRMFRRAVELDERVPAAQLSLGDTYLSLRQYSSAIKHLERATQLAPTNATAWHFLGDAYRSLGDASRAAAAYKRSLELDPSRPDIVEKLRHESLAARRAP
jgi:tetratricopeptide (TPR) repeat protein